MPPKQTQKTSQTVSDLIYEHLLHKMDTGEILPGNSLNLAEISTELGISSTPLREALIRLEAEGFVSIFPRSKVVVNRLELEDIEYLYEVIGSLETVLAIRGIEKYTDEALARMAGHIDTMEAALKEGAIRHYTVAHKAVHAMFLEMAPNRLAERILIPQQYRLWDLPQHNFVLRWLQQACDEHWNILEALRMRDVEKVAFLIKEDHWCYRLQEDFIRQTYF